MAVNSLGRFIRECRESLNFTSRKVEELSRNRPGLVPISHSNLLAIEKGSHVPTFDKILTLAAILNVPTRHFEDRLKTDMVGEAPASESQSYPALMAAGLAAMNEGQESRALELFTQAYGRATAEADTPPELLGERLGEARLQVATCRVRMGLLRIAKEDLEELLTSEQLPARLALRTSFLLSEVHRRLNNWRLALLHAKSCLELTIGPDDQVLRAKVLNTVGNILDERGDTAAAVTYYSDALRVFEKLGDRRACGLLARNLGMAHARLKQLEPAQRFMLDGLNTARETNDVRGRAYGHANLAWLYYLKGDTTRSREQARQAKQLAQNENYPDVLFMSLFYLWKAAIREGQVSLSRVYADRLGTLQHRLEESSPELEEWLVYCKSSRRVRA